MWQMNPLIKTFLPVSFVQAEYHAETNRRQRKENKPTTPEHGASKVRLSSSSPTKRIPS
jgi:hypothetical protein